MLLLVLFGFISILSYKDRKERIALNNISVFINALLLGLLAYWLLTLCGGIDFPQKGIEPVFPFLSIICLLIANVYVPERRTARRICGQAPSSFADFLSETVPFWSCFFHL